jgi:ribonuclease Y
METFQLILVILAAISAGSVLGYFARQTIAKRQAETAEAKVEKIFGEANDEAKEIILKAKDKAAKELDEIKEEEKEQRKEFFNSEQRLQKKEENIDRQLDNIEKNKNLLQEKADEVKKIRGEAENIKKEQVDALQKISGLSLEQAKEELIKKTEKEHQEELVNRMKKLEEEGTQELHKKAQDIMTSSMQRYTASLVAEITTSTLLIPTDELKGRIIGREGRNIRTIENLTGVDIIIDDTPETIVISGFDPMRRQIAKTALEKLIEDGRIHPAKIEEAVAEAKKNISQKIQESGEAICYELGITGIDPKLVKLLGRLRFRTSYGQNVLLHSMEVAYLASAIAAEVGADVNVCKKAGLFHDIGKAIDHEVKGSHVEIGRNILAKFGFSDEIIKAMQSHHEEYPYESPEAIIVQVADAISGGRPGARKDTLENYLKRLEDLEAVANSFEGIEKTYAVQAGREIRVFVVPEKISDLEAVKLSKKIADKIEDKLEYPGEIKVHVIRETRVINYAR